MTETIQEIHDVLAALEADTGPNADTHISTCQIDDEPPQARILLWPLGVTKCDHITGTGENFTAAAMSCAMQWAEDSNQRDEKRAVKLALKIIELTFDQGSADPKALRAAGFTDREVSRLSETALAMVEEMRGNEARLTMDGAA